MEVFRRQLESNPTSFCTQVVRANARRALAADTSESDVRASSMRVFFERHVNFGKARGVAYLAYGLATVADQMQAH